MTTPIDAIPLIRSHREMTPFAGNVIAYKTRCHAIPIFGYLYEIMSEDRYIVAELLFSPRSFLDQYTHTPYLKLPTLIRLATKDELASIKINIESGKAFFEDVDIVKVQ